MIEQSQELDKLAASLVKAQTQIKTAIKDAKNPHFNSRYADLAAIVEASRPALTANGIAVIQLPLAEPESRAVIVSTMLLHESGQWIRSSVTSVPKDLSPQSVGSAITYARRYGLSAMVGIVADDDDDGNAASHHSPARAASKTAPPLPKAELRPDIAARIQELVNETTYDLAETFRKAGVSEIKHFTSEQATKLIAFLEKRLKEQQAEADAKA